MKKLDEKYVDEEAMVQSIRSGVTDLVQDTITNDSNMQNIFSFDHWLVKQCEERPQSDIWNKAQKLDLLILQFVKTLREGDFLCYQVVLNSLMKWEMALDRNNYERYLPLMILKDANR